MKLEDLYIDLVDNTPRSAKPSWPIYVPSKGRSDYCKTIDHFIFDGIPANLVVEPQDEEAYVSVYGDEPLVTILVLPENDQGISFVRNFIKDHSESNGYLYSWTIDDNIMHFRQRLDGKNVKTTPGWMMHIVEVIMETYTNIGGIGFIHDMFAFTKKTDVELNKQIYSCVLLRHNIDCRYRDETVEDTDYSLQLLTTGLCTILLNRFIISKPATMKVKGGNTDTEYAGDGRLKRSLGLQTQWPEAKFKITEQYGRVKIKPSKIWSSFRQVPKLPTDIELF